MPRSYSTPLCIPVKASATVTTSASGSNLKNTANAIPLVDAATFWLEVTTLTNSASVAGVTQIDVYIDSSPDGGTTWYPAVHFAPVTTSTGISKHDCRLSGVGPNEVIDSRLLGATIATTNSTGNTVLTADQRVRWAFNSGTNLGPSSTFVVWAICMDTGTYSGG